MWLEIKPDVIESFAEKRFIAQLIIIGVWKNKTIIIIAPDKIRYINKNNSQVKKEQQGNYFRNSVLVYQLG